MPVFAGQPTGDSGKTVFPGEPVESAKDPNRPFESFSDYWKRGQLPGLIRPVIEGIESRSLDLTGKGKPIGSTETTPEDLAAVMAFSRPMAPGQGKRIAGIREKADKATGKETPQEILRGQGVLMTPGQQAGGIGRRMEEWFQSAPILGSFMRNAKKQTIESFDVAVLNQALAPINRSIPKGTDAGHEAMRYADKAFDEAYQRVKPKIVSLKPDEQFAAEANEIAQSVTELPQERKDQFIAILKNTVFNPKRRAPDGTLDGEGFKRIEEDLGRIANDYRASTDADQRQFSHRLDEMKLALRSLLARADPQSAEALKAVNAGYAILVRAQGAASRRASSQGYFTPSDLLQVIKSQDRSVRKTDFANGDALMQKFAEAGQAVLPNTVPDSGTVERGLFLGATYGAYHLLDPNLLAVSGLLSLPYTSPGMRALNAVTGGATPRAFPRVPGGAGAAALAPAPDQDNAPP